MRVPVFAGTGSSGSKGNSGKRAGSTDNSGTGVNAWQSLGWGIAATIATVLLLLPIKKSFLGEVFFSGGWVNYAELFLFAWGMAILALKSRKIKAQRDALLLDVVPRGIAEEITSENVGEFLDHVAHLPQRVRGSLMVQRIQRGLELFQNRGSSADVSAFISSQSDVDANRITGTYAMLKVFLWAIPILGFIGTVLGLSMAMENFGSTDLADMNQLKKSVGDITSGLATAFNTTLLGLILSMLLIFPLSALQKNEDDMLTDIDAFCGGILLPRLNDGSGTPSLQSAAAAPIEWMEGIMQRQGEYVAALTEHTNIMREAAEAMRARADSTLAATQLEFAKSLEKLTETSTKAIAENVKATGAYFNVLHEGIGGLNAVLKDLGERQVVIQKKKGWF